MLQREHSTRVGLLLSFCRRWYGVLLTAAIAVSALWLALTERHTLYVHPRYTVFIIEMSALAVVACVWAFWQVGASQEECTGQAECCVQQADCVSHDGHTCNTPIDEPEHAGELRETGKMWRAHWFRRATTLVTGSLVLTAAIMVLALPPAPLSPSMVAQRSIGTSAAGRNAANIVRSLADLPAEPRISDWSMLLMSQTSDDLTGVPATVTGFVTTTPEIADQGYYLVRFTIICCAVDAFPAQIPVYDPHWREHVQVGQWLKVSGNFQPAGVVPAGGWGDAAQGADTLSASSQSHSVEARTGQVGTDQSAVGRSSVGQGSAVPGGVSGTEGDLRGAEPEASSDTIPGVLEQYMLHPTQVTPIPEPAEPYLY